MDQFEICGSSSNEGEEVTELIQVGPRSRAARPVTPLLISALIVTGLAAGLIWIFISSEMVGSERTRARISWRALLFLRKAEGEVPDLSIRELWFMTHTRGGFSLESFVRQGYSLEGIVTDPFTANEDQKNGAAIFSQRCAMCHGRDGAGGHAPNLNRLRFNHGDSDFTIYKIIRDGIRQTGMAAVPMSIKDRWQVVGYLRTLRLNAFSLKSQRLPAIDFNISSDELRNAGSHPDQWLTYSRTLDGQRYIPVAQITPANVSQLQIRWVHQFETSETKGESTPIVAGGVIFTTEPDPSDVVALDAKSGEVRWRYERHLPNQLPLCCGRVNRGLAVLGDTLYLGTLDGYLVAIESGTGDEVWKNRVANPTEGYTMTGAPLIANGSVIVGVAGGEYGIRGFVAAYDAKTGEQQWKFNTIPGPGEFGHETWENDAWRSGGGATWVTGSYDPSLDLVYWGVGNPGPDFQGDVRPGDNLFTDSVVALHASSGKLAWHFQFTPHDEWDRDATQTPVLTDLPINGVLRRVLCLANRNGFYYVLDRTTGAFLTGVTFVQQNWAKGLDAKGRPIVADAEGTSSGRVVEPGLEGGVNWQNTAFDPRSRRIFVPATEGASVFTKSPNPRRGELGFYIGSAGDNEGDEESVVRALDAATGETRWERWERDLPPTKRPLANGYGGLLATGGGLVFGTSGGFAFAMDSATGRELWRVYLGGDTFAAPISFNVEGQQCILVSAGRSLFLFGL